MNQFSQKPLFVIGTMLVWIGLVAGCAAPMPPGPSVAPSPTPFALSRADAPDPTATPTFTATAVPAPTQTATPLPTSTPTPTPTPAVPPTETPTETAAMAGAATPTPTPSPTPVAQGAAPTPTVVIPQGWPVYTDTRLGYSLATPSTWIRVDLRSEGFRSLARLFGASAAGLIEQIEAFLATPGGETIGVMALEPDITQFFAPAPFPAFGLVWVLDLPPDVTAEQINAVLAANAALFGAVTVESSTVETINNLPAVRVSSQADLRTVGYPVQAYMEQVGLLANSRLYVLTLTSRADLADRKRATFDAIIGTFRPE